MARPSPSSAAAARRRSSTPASEERAVPFVVVGFAADAVAVGVATVGVVLGSFETTLPAVFFEVRAFLLATALSWPLTL